MDKSIALAVFTLLAIVALSFLQSIGILNFHGMTGMFVGYGSDRPEKWWNNTWSYRQCIEINSSSRNRTNWPVELDMNFSDLMPSGEFDENSIRLIEYISDTSTNEVMSQFEKGPGYNYSNNAIGTLVFLLNDTMNANTNRTFCVYYDSKDHLPKNATNYSNMTYSEDGDIINVNTTSIRVYIDKNMGENLSGIYYVERVSDSTGIVSVTPDARPAEYLEYWNGTDNLSFEIDSVTIIEGPIRITVKINGTENTIGGNKTNRTYIEKYYFIYNRSGTEERGGFIKIKQSIKNIHTSSINLSSLNAGAPALDLSRAFSTFDQALTGVNNTNPFSYARAAAEFEFTMVGIINMNQTGTSNFFADNKTIEMGRIGITLNQTTLNQNQTITQTSLVYFGAFDDPGSEFQSILMSASNPENIYINGPERVHVLTMPFTNASTYNRNETILIRLNVTGDPYNLTKYVNATINNGSSATGDDIIIQLYDDGTHGDQTSDDKNFTNTYTPDSASTAGEWEINFTIYDNEYVVIDRNQTKFNLTDQLNANISMITERPLINSVASANMVLMNYRNDTYIIGAQINCSVNSTPEITSFNVTDQNNGSYMINFTAPSDISIFMITCNATISGNKANASTSFETEPANTSISIITTPTEINLSNITMYQSQSFDINVTVNNTGNGTAANVTIYFNLSTGWTVQNETENCGTLNKQTGCEKSFNITSPANTTPGSYNVFAIVNWTNPDSSKDYNQTATNATVEENPLIDVNESQVKKEARDGIEILAGNFTIESLGNFNLTNINFSCISGEVCQNFTVEFEPANISNLANGATQKIDINVTVPQYYPYGVYTGIVNVSSANDGSDTFILNITVPSKAKINLTINASSFTAQNITMANNQTFSFDVNATNIGNGTARNITLNVSVPLGWLTVPQNDSCSDQKNSESCSRSFNVTIPNATNPGTYRINATSNWTNPDSTKNTSSSFIDAIVSSNPKLNVPESDLAGTVNGGNDTNIVNFTVMSIGNDNITGTTFNCSSGEVCQNFTVTFYPTSIDSLDNGMNMTVMVNVSVPTTYEGGTYNGTILVNTTDGGYDTFNLNVTVPIIRVWNMTPRNCSHSESGGYGTVCFVNITNNGNTQISFNISPVSANETSINETSFSVSPRATKTIEVLFNMTNATERPINVSYIVDALDADTYPDNSELRIFLVPTTEPSINASVVPDRISGEGYVEIYANVSDRSTTGIAWVRANVSDPNGTVTNLNMNNIAGNNWYVRFPQLGNISAKGIYNVTVYASDNIGNVGNVSTSFKIYSFLNISSYTLSTRYYQGDTATIIYSAYDKNRTGVSNASVRFLVTDNNSNIFYLSNYTTSYDGKVYPLPTFILPSDATTANYTLQTNTTYHDIYANETIEDTRITNFTVVQRTITVTGLFAQITTAVVWYPDNTMKFSVLVYNGEGRPIDPDNINLTVFDPADNVYFEVNSSDMEKNATGYYLYRHAMASSTPTGMFVAVADVSDGDFETKNAVAFRVAKGGPYDVRIYPLQTEVEQGAKLDFNMIIENKGEVTQDVFLEYWIESSNNQTYYSASEAVLTPAHSNQTFTRRADIYSTQPTGMYYLKLRMNYDTVQAPIYSNSTFLVTPRKNQTTPVYYVDIPITSPAVQNNISQQANASEVFPGILIEKYNTDIRVARGFTKMENIIIRNTGKTVLKNISMFMTGISPEWYSFAPERYASLPPGDATTFVVTYDIPRASTLNSYNATLVVSAGVLQDAKPIKITVYLDMRELLEDEIKAVKSMLVDFLVNMTYAERAGKDTSGPSLLVPEINSLIQSAEDNLNSGNLELSLKKITDAKTLLDRAINMLNNAPLKPGAFEMPLWGWFLIVLIIMAVVAIYIRFSKNGRTQVRPYLTMLGKVTEAVKGRPKDMKSLMEEEQKLVNVLAALEKQKNEGIISPTAYRNMKNEFENRLAKLKKQLGMK